MFKKLKEKITEEVKSSPQRFQQLTQSVSDRLQNSATSDENFFSIGEDDSNTSLEAGFTNVSLMSSPQEPRIRRNSNSSVASDVSFLPRYESFPNMYHLQSDLEVSASELEDNASTSSQLGHLSKEQIYAAFQKAQMRYHKYRGRYTDLAKHYKDLERDNTKMKSVLVETQDKAIRRVTELREQCNLEQKAKMHLEAALRDELDEKEFKIQSLQTKIELLQNGAPGQEMDNSETLKKYLTEARQEIESLNERLQETKANSIIFQTKEREYKGRISNLEREISLFSEREKENNLSLAQNKMELHNELLGKDQEIATLKQDNEALKKTLEGNTKLENLQTQNKKLIEKVEVLTKKCNVYENDLLKVEQLRIELQNSHQTNADLRTQLEEVREEAKKAVLNLEGKIREQLRAEFAEKEENLRRKFEENSDPHSLRALQLSLIEKNEEINRLRQDNDEISEDLAAKIAKYDDLEHNHLELIEESAAMRKKIGDMELAAAESTNLTIGQLREENEDLAKKAEENAKLREEMQLLKTAIEEKKKNLEHSLEEERLKVVQKLEESEATVKKLEEAALVLNRELKKIEEKDEEIASLRTELEQSVQRNRKLEEKVKNSEAQEARISEEKIRKLEETVKKLVEDLDRRGEEMLKLKKENEAALSEHIAVQEERRKLFEELSILTKRVEESESSRKKLEDEKEETVKKRGEEELKKARLLKKLEEETGARIRELEETVKKRDEETKATQEELKKRVQDSHLLKRLEEESEERGAKIRELEETVKKRLKENKAVEEELKKRVQHSKKLQEESEEKEAKIRELEETVKKHLEESRAVEEELEKRVQDSHSLKKLEEATGARIRELEETVKKLTKEHEAASRAVEEELKKRAEESHLLKNIEAENEELRLNWTQTKKLDEEKIRSLEETVKKRLEEHEELKKRIEDSESQLREKETVAVNLETTVAQLKKKLKNLEENTSPIDERDQLLDEVGLLKKLLEEANNNLTIKEHEMKKFEENHSNSLNEKTRQIETLSRKLEEYNDLIEDRNLQIFKIFNPGETPNHFERGKNRKNLENLEEKLQNFEQIFSSEKENLAKVVTCLKQFEERHSSILAEKEQLEREIKQLEEELARVRGENRQLEENEEKLKQNLLEVESRNVQVVSDSNFLSEENNSLVTEVEELKVRNEDVVGKYAEFERQLTEMQHEKQLLEEEIVELKTAPLNLQNERNGGEDYVKEIEHLRTKIVQYKSLDLTNRSSIEFYENELQKLKNQNEKLNRKLDETLVTLNHCSELSNSTEIEYLRNVLYNYMLGKESIVLARVIAAVCKFDPQQTETILAKEQQKQTLLGQLGIL